jgi:hypothetical protein
MRFCSRANVQSDRVVQLPLPSLKLAGYHTVQIV